MLSMNQNSITTEAYTNDKQNLLKQTQWIEIPIDFIPEYNIYTNT